MAKKDAFLLVSLEEDKAKKLASVIGNESCRKIIDCLAGNDDATETELSERLSIPISTVHYNIQLLQDSGLVVAEEFHYSKKGREVLHYKLANRYIVIAPKTTEGMASKLKKLLPAFAFVAFSSVALQIMVLVTRMGSFGAGYASKAMEESASPAAGVSAIAPAYATQAANYSALFLFAGGLLALIAYFAYDLIRDKIKYNRSNERRHD